MDAIIIPLCSACLSPLLPLQGLVWPWPFVIFGCPECGVLSGGGADEADSDHLYTYFSLTHAGHLTHQ